jgi:transposase
MDLHHDRRVEPTNNRAERSLRGPVIRRELSQGTHSETGERFAERGLSAATTCRLRRRSLFTYLSELIATHNRGDPFPALTCTPRTERLERRDKPVWRRR